MQPKNLKCGEKVHSFFIHSVLFPGDFIHFQHFSPDVSIHMLPRREIFNKSLPDNVLPVAPSPEPHTFSHLQIIPVGTLAPHIQCTPKWTHPFPLKPVPHCHHYPTKSPTVNPRIILFSSLSLAPHVWLFMESCCFSLRTLMDARLSPLYPPSHCLRSDAHPQVCLHPVLPSFSLLSIMLLEPSPTLQASGDAQTPHRAIQGPSLPGPNILLPLLKAQLLGTHSLPHQLALLHSHLFVCQPPLA